MPWRKAGKVWSVGKLGSGHVVTASFSQPSSPQMFWVSGHPAATITGISEAAFAHLLKGQISFIVSSLSAFSNHSHGFALFILIVLLIIGVILCLQLSQRSQRLAVSNSGSERIVEVYPAPLSPFIHLHWFPLDVRVATVVTFFFLFLISCDIFLVSLPHFSSKEGCLKQWLWHKRFHWSKPRQKARKVVQK